MPRNVDNVIDAPGDPVIAVLIAATPVAGEIIAFVITEICLFKAFMVAPDSTHLTGPAIGDAQNTFDAVAVYHFTCRGFQHDRLDPEERFHGGTGLGRVGTGKRGHQMAARFSLPPGIYDRAGTFPDYFVVPVPSFRVDWFPHCAKQLEAAQIAPIHKRPTFPHQCPDRSRRGVKLVNLVLFANLPKSAGIGIGWHAFEHQCCSTIGQRAIDDIAVSRNPAHVGGAPIYVTVMVIERHLMGQRRIDQIPARAMHNALRLPGGSRGIQDKQWILGVHRLGGTGGVGRLGQGRIVYVAGFIPSHVPAGAAHHQTFDRRIT